MKYAMIVNMRAGNGRCTRLWPQIEACLKEAGAQYGVYSTEYAGHARELAQQAALAGYDVVVSVGGDGTLNEVVNGIHGTGAILGIIPAGSGNDFSRAFGYSQQDIRQACTWLLAGTSREIDVGRVDQRMFLNVAGAGFDAEVGRMANVWGKKYFAGYLAYLASIIRVLVSFSPRELVVDLDGTELRQKAWLVAVGNAQYFGGGLRVTPDADVNDGLFDVCIVGETSKLELLRVLPRVREGKHLGHPAIQMHRAARVSIVGDSALAAQADGEIVGNLPAVFSIASAKMKAILPA